MCWFINIEENVMNLSISVNLVHDDHLHSIAELRISTNMDINEVLDNLSSEFIKELDYINTLVSNIPEPLVPIALAFHGSQDGFSNLVYSTYMIAKALDISHVVIVFKCSIIKTINSLDTINNIGFYIPTGDC